jgi:hypothetical protein
MVSSGLGGTQEDSGIEKRPAGPAGHVGGPRAVRFLIAGVAIEEYRAAL